MTEKQTSLKLGRYGATEV